jgi:hypothetical protein
MSDISAGRRVKVGVVFECPDDEYVSLASDPDAKVGLAEELKTTAIDDAVVDREMGLSVTPIAQLTVTRLDGQCESAVFMTKEQLVRLAYECRAVVQTMNEAAKLADRHWAEYRRGVMKREGT